MNDWERRLSEAFARHQAGSPAEAETIYRQLLAAQPNRADVWHLLGVAQHQLGRQSEAVDAIGRAIRLNPQRADFHNHLGAAQGAGGALADAIASFRRAIALDGDRDPHVRCNLAVALSSLGQIDEAIAEYRQVLALRADFSAALVGLAELYRQRQLWSESQNAYRHVLGGDPNHLAARIGLGRVLDESGQPEAAAVQFQAAISTVPHAAEPYFRLGCLLQNRGDAAAAVQAFEAAIARAADHADAWNNLGCALLALERHADAENALRRAIVERPHFVEAHNNLGSVLQAAGRLSDAIACYGQAAALKPDFAAAHNNLGAALRECKRPDEAAHSLDKAIALEPALADAHMNLGTVRSDQGRFDEAAAHLLRACELRASDPQIHFNLGLVRHQQQCDAEAVACYDEALRLRPDHPEAHFNRGVVWLGQGDFGRGWPEYEWRFRCRRFKLPKHAQPMWDGSPLDGQTLLVHAEQGLGDTLHFIRYLPLVEQRAKRMVVEVQPTLVPLLRESGFAVVPQGEAPGPVDVQIPLVSLPRVLATTLDNMPADVPYLSVAAERIAHWRRELARWPGLRVGIAWQGNPDFEFDRFRSVPLAEFAPLAAVPGVRLFSLQKGAGSEQISALGGAFEMIDWGPTLDAGGAFLDTAALVRALDLVIVTDSSVAHLAGALAAPAWVATAAVPDWRWFVEREDSPWYPSIRLFRQARPGSWGDVFDRMATEVGKLVATKKNG